MFSVDRFSHIFPQMHLSFSLKCWIFNPCLDMSLKSILCDAVTNFPPWENLMTQLFRLWVYENWAWLSRLSARIIVSLPLASLRLLVFCLFAFWCSAPVLKTAGAQLFCQERWCWGMDLYFQLALFGGSNRVLSNSQVCCGDHTVLMVNHTWGTSWLQLTNLK